jgi:hypothetical protein
MCVSRSKLTSFLIMKWLGWVLGNRGAFGAGIYFSEYTSTSIAYNRTSGSGARMLLSKVLMGRMFQCKGGMLGAPLTRGYHIRSPFHSSFSPIDSLIAFILHIVMIVTSPRVVMRLLFMTTARYYLGIFHLWLHFVMRHSLAFLYGTK